MNSNLYQRIWGEPPPAEDNDRWPKQSSVAGERLQDNDLGPTAHVSKAPGSEASAFDPPEKHQRLATMLLAETVQEVSDRLEALSALVSDGRRQTQRIPEVEELLREELAGLSKRIDELAGSQTSVLRRWKSEAAGKWESFAGELSANLGRLAETVAGEVARIESTVTEYVRGEADHIAKLLEDHRSEIAVRQEALEAKVGAIDSSRREEARVRTANLIELLSDHRSQVVSELKAIGEKIEKLPQVRIAGRRRNIGRFEEWLEGRFAVVDRKITFLSQQMAAALESEKSLERSLDRQRLLIEDLVDGRAAPTPKATRRARGKPELPQPEAQATSFEP